MEFQPSRDVTDSTYLVCQAAKRDRLNYAIIEQAVHLPTYRSESTRLQVEDDANLGEYGKHTLRAAEGA